MGVPDDADHVIEAEGRGPRLRARAWPLGAVVRGHTSAGEGRAADVVSRPRLGHRAHPRGRRRDRRPQPQELPRPVLRRDPHTPTRSVHGESRASISSETEPWPAAASGSTRGVWPAVQEEYGGLSATPGLIGAALTAAGVGGGLVVIRRLQASRQPSWLGKADPRRLRSRRARRRMSSRSRGRR